MYTIARSYPDYPFRPFEGAGADSAAPAPQGSFFSAVLNGAVCYVEALPPDLFTEHEARVVTWFRALQTLPAHTNVLPYHDKLVVCPAAGDTAPPHPAGPRCFLVSLEDAATVSANGPSTGPLRSLPAYLDEQREKLGHTASDLTVPENSIRSIAADILSALYHLHLHGLVHRHVCPSAVRISAATTAARLGDLGYSIDSFSGASALTLCDADVVSDVRGLGHVVLALMAADATVAVPPTGLEDVLLPSLVQHKGYSQSLMSFAQACLRGGSGEGAIEDLFQHRFLLPIVVADAHRSRVAAVGSAPLAARSPPRSAETHVEQGSLPMPLTANALSDRQRDGSAPHIPFDASSVRSLGSPVIAEALPSTTTGLGSPFSPGSLRARSFLVPKKVMDGDSHVMTCGAALPKREQYYYVEGGQRRYLASYGIVFELEVHRPITLEDLFFTTVGDIRSMHVQLYWRAGGGLRGTSAAEEGAVQGEWVPVLRRPKHLRKVMAHKPQSVGPFSLRLPFADSLAGASRNRHSLLLVTNYAHGVRLYGLPHGLLGHAVGAPLDTDGVVTISTGVSCGADVCAATATAALHAQARPDSVRDDESTDSDEVEDPRSPAKEEPLDAAAARARVSAALDRAVADALARPLECPHGLFGGLKYKPTAA